MALCEFWRSRKRRAVLPPKRFCTSKAALYGRCMKRAQEKSIRDWQSIEPGIKVSKRWRDSWLKDGDEWTLLSVATCRKRRFLKKIELIFAVEIRSHLSIAESNHTADFINLLDIKTDNKRREDWSSLTPIRYGFVFRSNMSFGNGPSLWKWWVSQDRICAKLQRKTIDVCDRNKSHESEPSKLRSDPN